MPTLLEILQKTTAYLAGKGIPNAKLHAELLLAHVLHLRRLDLYLQFDRPLNAEQLDALRPLVARRGKREPLEYITGSRPFVGLDLLCDARALIPRSETEELVELLTTRFTPAAISNNACTPVVAAGISLETAQTTTQAAPQMPAPQPNHEAAAQQQPVPSATPLSTTTPEPRRILDLGTGTGALALALAQAFPQAEVVAVDYSADTLTLARANAEHNGLTDRVRFLQSDWFAALPQGEAFDLIVSNPPYLTEEEWTVADPEVKTYEPYRALVAPENGLADLRLLIAGAPQFLAAGGLLALETGIAQHGILAELAMTTSAYAGTESLHDSDGRERFFLAHKR